MTYVSNNDSLRSIEHDEDRIKMKCSCIIVIYNNTLRELNATVSR